MSGYEEIRKLVASNNRFAEIVNFFIRMENDDCQKAELISYLSIFYINHFTGKYSDENLETQLNRIGENIPYQVRIKPEKNKILHVMTYAWYTGGHTEVVNNWIQFDRSREYSIAFTGMAIENTPEFLKKTVDESGGKIFCLSQKDYIHMAKRLLSISEGFEKIVLHIDMCDVVPIIAYSNKNWKVPVYFYNHGNFSFSLGVSIADCVFNICIYDMLKTRRYRGGKEVALLPVPSREIYSDPALVYGMNKAEIKRQLCKEYEMPEDCQIIISMGSDYKYKKIIGYDFGAFVRELLKQTGENTYFIIIGANPESQTWKELSENTIGRAKAVGILPREQVSLWMKAADAYVSSFPMISAGYLEARKNNVPTFSLKVTNREKEYLENEWSLSTEELIAEIKNQLTTRQTIARKKSPIDELRENPLRWCGLLDHEWQKTRIHGIHKFKNVPALTKEEAIHIQLKQGEQIFTYVRWDYLSRKNRIILRVLEKISGLCRK